MSQLKEKSMNHNLPELPYGYGDLAPVISEEIMTLHHQKHHQGYVNNLNNALVAYKEAESNQDLQKMVELQSAIKFNAGGHINHSIFWTNLAPKGKGGGEGPSGSLKQAIDSTFGSVDKLIETFNTTTGPLQGSGWGWLGYNPKKKTIAIATCQNQDPLSTQGLVPLLGIDVWEHAYYLQYKNLRPKYLESIWDVVNWKNVEERFSKASS
jgi:superoxide dismutase, Fe-Mn family